MPIIGQDLDELIGDWVVDLDTGTLFRVTGYVAATKPGDGVVFGLNIINNPVRSRGISVLSRLDDRWLKAHMRVVD